MGWVLAMLLPSIAAAQVARRDPDPAALGRLAELTAGLTPIDAQRIKAAWTDDGVLNYLSAPAGRPFTAPTRVPGRPEAAASAFLAAHRVLFGIRDGVEFGLKRARESDGRRNLKMQQMVGGVPVFGGELVVQMTANDDVEAVLGNIARGDATPTGTVRPTLDEARATAVATALAASRGASPEFSAAAPRLTWFVPAVLRQTGEPRLTWLVEVRDPIVPGLNARWLIDASDGSIVREYTRHYEALVREIRDMANDTTRTPPPVTRSEGGAATGIGDVDDAYAMLGDTYAFYQSIHGRDGFNGAGITNVAWVRVCTKQPGAACPWQNASYSSNLFKFGAGWVEDDIVAHEFGHAVTDYESDLIYENESGAINESLSDIWGEFVDLGNGRGNDAANVRWLIAEDRGAIRDMEDPTGYGDPDRRLSSLYAAGCSGSGCNSGNDYGGVHTNSGINNKLCFLLTDGGTFNGQTVVGYGIATIAGLYYEAQVDLLVASSGWTDLANALQQAAMNNGWGEAAQNNLYAGLRAVEIATGGRDIFVHNAGSCLEAGLATCVMGAGPYRSVPAAISNAFPGDRIWISAGSYSQTFQTGKAMILRAVNGTATLGP